MMKRIIPIISFACALCLLPSCQTFLDKSPNTALDINIDSEDKIAELLTGSYPTASYIPFLEPRTDNVEERVGGVQSRLGETMYFWEDYDSEDIDAPQNYWNECYRGIAGANKALELLSTFPTKTERIKALYGEAFMLRAYLHFMLVNIWSDPYGRSEDSPGIPYLTKPEKNAFVKYPRETVAKTYEKIEQDLKLGLSLINDHYYKQSKYHFNKRAAYAFASRVYLMMGKWDEVIACADYALGADAGTDLRPWIKLQDELSGKREQLAQSYTAPNNPSNLLIASTESRLARLIAQDRYGATTQVVDKIFKRKTIKDDDQSGDATLIYPFVYAPAPLRNTRYLVKFDERPTLRETSETHPRGLIVPNILLSVDEVLLNRMEAYTMLSRYDKAIADLKVYTMKKLGYEPRVLKDRYTQGSTSDYSVYAPFYGLSVRQLPMIKTILHFRQMEFFEEGLRWFDIRRFNLEITRSSRNSFYRPLKQNDPRQNLQIPVEAVSSGLEANPREGNNHLIRH